MHGTRIAGAALALAVTATTIGAVRDAQAAEQLTGRSAIFAGGPLYSGGQGEVDTVRRSGFTTVILWTIHVVKGSGDLVFNDQKVVSGGSYVGDPGWPGRIKSLKNAPTSVNRVEISVGSAGVDDWDAITGLMASGGTGPGSILYRNFRALLDATGADAVNDDDEMHYGVGSTTNFGTMVGALGRHFTIAPYTNASFWAQVRHNLGGTLDRAYLQVYAGGAGNDPAQWRSALGMDVDPGMWSRHGGGCASGSSPAQVKSAMSAWRASAGIPGGFLWIYDDVKACSSSGSAKDYATAINTA